MKAYICDVPNCGQVIKDKKEVTFVNIAVNNEQKSLHICKDCFKKLEYFFNNHITFKEEWDNIGKEIVEDIKDTEVGVEETSEDTKDTTIENSVENIEPKKDVEINNTESESNDKKSSKQIKDKKHKPTIAEHIESMGGIDVLMTAICKKEKSIPEFEAEFGISKNSLRTYLSMHKISIKEYADSHGIQLGKDTSDVKLKIQLKIKEIGLENILESLANKEKTMEDVAQEIGVTKSQLNYYFHNNYISIRDYKENKKKKQNQLNKQINTENELNNEDLLKLINAKASCNHGVRAVAKGDLKNYEETIEVVSGSCFGCAYRDLDSNTCGYTILTGKSRHGGKGKCNHFVDVKRL